METPSLSDHQLSLLELATMTTIHFGNPDWRRGLVSSEDDRRVLEGAGYIAPVAGQRGAFRATALGLRRVEQGIGA